MTSFDTANRGGAALRLLPVVLAASVWAFLDCNSNGNGTVTTSVGGFDAGDPITEGGAPMDDANAAEAAAVVEGGGSGDEGSATAGDSAGGGAPEAQAAESQADTTHSFVRIADWAPDAPKAGLDICLAPHGTNRFTGPLLAQELDAGAIGQGSVNGVEFPWVTAYLPVAPGQYDLQVVAAGSTDCTNGIIPPTMGLPALSRGNHVTLAVVGDINATDNDPSAKVSFFFDDTSVPDGSAAVRFINASPAVAAANAGTGSLGNHNFSEWYADVQFGAASAETGDGGSTDPNGYSTTAPLAGVEFSAQAVGTSIDSATAAHVSAAAGAIVTLALVHGENGGLPPQFLSCLDNAPPAGAQTQCTVLPHE